MYEQRARCYLNTKKFQSAATDISKALALKPNTHDDWYALRAQIYAQVDAFDLAIKDLDTAIRHGGGEDGRGEIELEISVGTN